MLRDLRTPFVLFALIWVTLGIYHHTQPEPIVYDAIEYNYSATNLVDHNVVYAGNLNSLLDYRLFSKRTIGYPIFRVFQWNTPWVVSLAQGGLLFFLYFLGMRLVHELDPRLLAKQMYSWLMVLSPILFFHSYLGMADLLLATVVTAMAYTWITPAIARSRKPWIITALFFAGVLVKPVLLPAFPLVLIYALVVGRKNYKVFATWLILGGTVWGLVALNNKNAGVREYSNISKINLATYNAKLTIAHVYGYDSAQRYAANVVQEVPRNRTDYAELNQRMGEVGQSVLRDNLSAYIKIHLIGAAKMALDPGRFDLYTFFREYTADVSLTEMLFANDPAAVKQAMGSKKWLVYLFGFLLIINVIKLLLALFSLASLKANHAILFLIIGYFLAITGPVGAGRFFLPVWIIGIVLSCLGLLRLVDRLQKSAKR